MNPELHTKIWDQLRRAIIDRTGSLTSDRGADVFWGMERSWRELEHRRLLTAVACRKTSASRADPALIDAVRDLLVELSCLPDAVTGPQTRLGHAIQSLVTVVGSIECVEPGEDSISVLIAMAQTLRRLSHPDAAPHRGLGASVGG